MDKCFVTFDSDHLVPPLDLTGTVHTVYYAPDTIDSKLIKRGGAPHTCTYTMHTFIYTWDTTPSHVHAFTCAHLHMCTPSHVHTFTCAHLHMCTPSHVHTFTYAHLHMHTFTCARLHMCTPSHVHTFTCAHLHICTPSHIFFTYSSECDKIGHKKISIWTIKFCCCC